MAYFFTIFSLGFLAVFITDILNIFFKKSLKFADAKKHWDEFLSNYKWMSLVAIVCACIILYNNFLFLDIFGIYRVEAMPCGLLYCHVEIKTNNRSAIYPCEIRKEKDEDGTFYELETIYMNGKSVDVSEYDMQVFTEKFVKNGKEEYKIINLKYDKKEDVYDSSYSRILEFADLILGLSCIYAPIKTIIITCKRKND